MKVQDDSQPFWRYLCRSIEDTKRKIDNRTYVKFKKSPQISKES